MMIPTKDDLNKKMAEVLGWKCAGEGFPDVMIPPSFPISAGIGFPVPQFCRDRNRLPEIIGAVRSASDGLFGPVRTFVETVIETGFDEWGEAQLEQGDILALFDLPMQRIVIAALLALDKWPDSWDKPLPSQPLTT